MSSHRNYNAGYTDQVFGLFRLLGYQFSPAWPTSATPASGAPNPDANYGPLNGIARHRVNTETSSPAPGTTCSASPAACPPAPSASARSSAACKAAAGPTPTGRAIAELGRIAKTLYLLAYLDDEPYRRRILTQLNRIEARHALARQVFHGQLRQLYREGQEDQLGTLATSTPPSLNSAATATPSRAPTSNCSHP